jgi:hypothetical protein
MLHELMGRGRSGTSALLEGRQRLGRYRDAGGENGVHGELVEAGDLERSKSVKAEVGEVDVADRGFPNIDVELCWSCGSVRSMRYAGIVFATFLGKSI